MNKEIQQAIENIVDQLFRECFQEINSQLQESNSSTNAESGLALIDNCYNLYHKNISSHELQIILRKIQQKQMNTKKKANTLLYLWGNNTIDEKGYKYLIKTKLNNLTCLNLGYNQIGDKGCENLAKGEWPFLKWLSLQSNQISENGCATLTKASWNRLQSISIQSNPIGFKGIHLLRRKYYHCSISCDYFDDDQ